MSKVSDPDLMMLADGELDAAAAGALERAAGASGAAKIAGIREVGELVRGHLELSADEADDRLAGLWTLVERRLDGEAVTDDAAAPAVVEPATPGVWSRVMRWIDGHRGHMLTGALSAGAVAAIAFMLRAEPQVQIVTVPGPTRSVAVGPGPGTATGPVEPMVLVASPPEVESLDVEGGTGTVFTISDDEGGSDTAVIWITPDDVLEGI